MDTHIHFIEKDYVLDAVISYDTFKELKKKFDYLDFVGIYDNEIVMLCSQYHTILMGVKYSNGLQLDKESIPIAVGIYKEVIK